MDDTKSFWTSKTLWVNILALIALIAQGQFGWVVSADIQAYALIGINAVLRLITKKPVTWS